MTVAMSTTSSLKSATSSSSEEDIELRKGPWTLEEDTLLIHYTACHGEGHWNLLAKRSGLKRTGKSCRLRWLNYLKPDVKRGNLSPQEQLLILELHSKLGNRWSKIAQHLPGRTDNEIKNYWRTRVQKQARNLKIDANSTAFQDLLQCFWIPRLLQKIERSSSPLAILSQNPEIPQPLNHATQQLPLPPPPPPPQVPQFETSNMNDTIVYCFDHHEKSSISSENSNTPSICSSRSMTMTTSSEFPQVSEYPTTPFHAFINNDYSTSLKDCYCLDNVSYDMGGSFNLASMSADPIGDSHVDESSNWVDNGLIDSLWNMHHEL